MEIKRVSCDQFAGLLDREIDLDKGLNIIVGENESGKSSLVDLIYNLFFQGTSLDMRRDKAFVGQYFPKTTGAVSGDIIDGTIRFETEEGVYKLAKEWTGKDSRCRLTLPDGTVIQNEEKINDVLAGILQYGRGVYDEMVFASQKRDQTLLRGLLSDKSSGNVDELAATIAKAVMQTGGIELGEAEAELNKTIGELDARWDFGADAPEGGRKRGIQHKWKVGERTILHAYYEKEEILALQKEAELAEKDVERINAALREQKAKLQAEEQRREAFAQVRAVISEQNSNRKLLDAVSKEADAMQAAIKQWPEAEEQKSRAEELKKQFDLAAKKQKYLSVKTQVEEKEKLEQELAGIGHIDGTDLETLRKLPQEIRMLQTKLKGLDLIARINQLGETEIQVTSSVTGRPVTIEDGAVRITEPVTISIPGIAEIDLAPEGVDVEDIRKRLDAASQRQQEIYAKYGVASADELEDLKRRADAHIAAIKNIIVKIDSLLQGEAWESLEKEVEAALRACRRRLGLGERVEQQDVGHSGSAFGVVKIHRDGLGRQGHAAVHVGDADLHLVFTVVQRKALLVDEGAREVGGIRYHGAVEGHLGERSLLPFAEHRSDFDRCLEPAWLKLFINRRPAVEGDGVLHIGSHAWHGIGRSRKIGLQLLSFHLGLACKSDQQKHHNGYCSLHFFKGIIFHFAKIGFFGEIQFFLEEISQPIEKCCTFAAEIWLSGR